MRRLLIAAALLVAAGTLPVAASDLCKPTTTPMAEDAILKILADKGYTGIRGLKREDGCLEAKGHDKDGRRVEIYVDPATGEIVKIKGGRS